jgi:23S rRNA (cytosine1962-C5)-methyltransferase
MTDLITNGWDEYRLLDSGGGRKLEKFGRFVVDRPEPQAMWSRRLSEDKWKNADAVFAGGNDLDADEGPQSGHDRWDFRGNVPETWPTSCRGVKFLGRFTAFRHMGYFPEQLPHWDWMMERIQGKPEPKILNLFAYTGVASLLAARGGAQVTHVDASKKAIGWAAENQELAGLENAKIRWICEDARKFVAREARRGNKYTGIVIDPPKFGRGPGKELWELFDDLKGMLELCRDVLEDKNSFVILTTYAVRASHYALEELCREVFAGAAINSGELVIQEQNAGRKIATSLFCRVER